MKTQIQIQELFVKMALAAWETQNARVTKLLASLTDDQLLSETAQGRNSGAYLIGHLTAVSDAMLPLLGLGEKLYPELEDIFLKNPDKSSLTKPSVSNIRGYWEKVNSTLSPLLAKMNADEWFTRHNAVSAEDFIKEPNRNKLNLLINRTNHTSYHLGQLVYLSKK
jgi:hypothetical protein